MIITDKFVFLHYPKTGGSFVEDILKKLHNQVLVKSLFGSRRVYQQLMLPNLKRIHGSEICNQHGTWKQIPEEHKNKMIISCMRNPFDFYVSHYEYRSWLNWNEQELDAIKEQFPEFPNLSFERYLLFINAFDIRSRVWNDELRLDIGMRTYSFIQFFFKNPREIIRNLDEQYVSSEAYRNDMPEIHFLRTENLNCDLYDVLLKLGYRKKDISFIKEEKKVNVTSRRPVNKHWQEYYTVTLYDYIKFKERFILRLFPEYGSIPIGGRNYGGI